MNVGIYVILTVFILSMLSLQDAYAENERLEYAVVNFDNKTLSLYFNTAPTFDSIDLSINSMNFSTYVIDNVVQNAIKLDSKQLEWFRNIECPTIYVKHGLTGTNYNTPLWVNFPTNGWISPKPGVNVECELTYKITGEFVPHMNEYIIDGLEAWSEINPGLKFKEIKTGVPNIEIKTIINSVPGSSGIACRDCLYIFNIYDPYKGGMVYLNYNLDFLPYTVVYIISHEFGHVVGLQHDENRENLMYSGGGNFQIPYDSLGYNIPSKIKWYDFDSLISTIHIIITRNDIINHDIVLGALIAGVIGFLIYNINSYLEKSNNLKNIRKCLDYELQTTINTLNISIQTLECFTNKGDLSQKRTEDEINNIKQEFDLGCLYLRIPLTDAIYSNNSVFNMKFEELKNIHDIQTLVGNYNDEIKAWYDAAQKEIQESIDSGMYNIHQLIFLFKHKELNEDLVKKLEKLQG